MSAPAFAQLGPKGSGSSCSADRYSTASRSANRRPISRLEEVDGKAISLSDFRGKKSVVLVFYRGYW